MRSSPRVGEVITISSPGLSQTRGSRTLPTPDGVPVETMSPGSSVISARAGRRSSGTEKIRSEVEASCIRSPFRSRANEIASWGAGLVGGDQRRAAGRRAVEDLAGHPLRRRELEVAGGEVVEQHVAGDRVERLGRVDLLAAAPDDEGDLGLVVDLLARRRQRHGRRPAGPARCGTWRRRSGCSGGSIPASAACER